MGILENPKTKYSNNFQCRCPSCSFKSYICGTNEKYNCVLEILEGPLSKTNGCNYLERKSQSEPLLITEGSKLFGQDSAPKIKNIRTSKYQKKEQDIVPGCMVLLKEHEAKFPDGSGKNWIPEMQEHINKVVEVSCYHEFSLATGGHVDEENCACVELVNVEDYWRTESMEVVWPTPLKTYKELHREPIISEKAMIMYEHRLSSIASCSGKIFTIKEVNLINELVVFDLEDFGKENVHFPFYHVAPTFQ